MKLDKELMGKIVTKAVLQEGDEFLKFLENLNLVVKPGDISQSVLVDLKDVL